MLSPVDIEALLGAGQRQATRRVWGEVAEIPAFNEAAKSGDARVLFQGAERGNAQLAAIFQFNEFGVAKFFPFSSELIQSDSLKPSAASST